MDSFGKGCGIGRGRGFSSQILNNLKEKNPFNSQVSSFNTNSDFNNDLWDEGNNANANEQSKFDGWGSKENFADVPKQQNRWNSGNDWDETENFKNGTESDFPRGGGMGQSNNKACYKCGEEGHLSRECSKSSSQYNGKKARAKKGKRVKGCFKCGDDGHMSRNCPNGNQENGSNQFKWNSGSASRSGDKGCFKCGESGHMARDCSSSNSGGGSKSSGCFKCGKDGHISKDCPNNDKKGSGCFKCGKEGHMAKDCTEKALDKDGKERPPPYIPPEPTEDEQKLFESVPTGINFSKYDSIPVEVSGEKAPPPINSFEEPQFLPTLYQNIQKLHYVKPTPVQKYAIPIILAKRDLMACAQTGSGKTAAFLLPIIQAMFKSPDLPNPSNLQVQEPWAIIVSPTRELAIQIYNEARKFSHGSILKVELVYGGTSVGYQSSKLRKGCHILVATPGRLLDFVDKDKISFAQLRYLILDEADRMLDMGFAPEIRKMVQNPNMPPKGQRQTLMFSATFPEEIQRMAADFLDNYLFLTVGIVGGANSDVEQTFYEVSQFDKRQKLIDILSESGNDRTLVFVEKKRTADFIASYTSQNGFPTTSIHGDRLQREREEALMDFRTGHMPVLVATAVAARGLDIKGVSHVINYDLPQTIQEYVHRIGRTGRVGNLGKATSFFDSEADHALAGELIKILQDSNQIVPDWLQTAAGSGMMRSFQPKNNYGAKDVRSFSKDSWETNNTFSSNSGNVAIDEEVWE